MHPDGEEIFFILEGAVEFTLLSATSSEKVKVACGRDVRGAAPDLASANLRWRGYFFGGYKWSH